MQLRSDIAFSFLWFFNLWLLERIRMQYYGVLSIKSGTAYLSILFLYMSFILLRLILHNFDDIGLQLDD
jgi:hypothetical protein